MTDSGLEAVLRRDRLVVAGALGIVVALAWGYVLWLAVDMEMGGMDMSGFRMIPAGTGLMAPAAAPWKAIEFGFVFAMWAVSRANDSDVRPRGTSPEDGGQAARRDRLVRGRLRPGLDRLFTGSNRCSMGNRTGSLARLAHGNRE
jgi:hypothetical protein